MSTPSPFSVNIKSPDQPEVLAPLTALDQHIHHAQAPTVTHHYILNSSELLRPEIDYANDHNRYAEITRMFITSNIRGQGAGHLTLQTLLHTARNKNRSTIRLKTGIDLIEAVDLHQRLGLYRIPAFCEYAATPNGSYCMKTQPHA